MLVTSCSIPFFLLRTAAMTGLVLAAMLLAAVPAWAMPVERTFHDASAANVHAAEILAIEPFLPSPDSVRRMQQDRAEAVRAAQASPDVAVFPILVAGPALAAARRLDNKVAQGAGAIAVIYPELAEPYRSVFAQIIGGIEDKAKGRVANIAVGPDVNMEELNNSLLRQDAKVVIALGRQGMKVASALDHNIGVVVGGVLTAPENEARNLQVNSLSPDPALLFSRLKKMMPGVRRVFTVYDPRQNTWMMRLAKEAARSLGLELTAYEAQDLRSAMSAYQEIFAAADGARDALWLPQDSTTVEDGSVLPLVLKESWNRNLAVFSSNFSHVKRGVLFSLYPDNVELGRSLAGAALGILASGKSGGSITPLREVLMAINLRTAKHLEIEVDRQQKFDMAFPEQ